MRMIAFHTSLVSIVGLQVVFAAWNVHAAILDTTVAIPSSGEPGTSTGTFSGTKSGSTFSVPTNGVTTVVTETFINPPQTLTITSVIPKSSMPLTILSTILTSIETGHGPVSTPHTGSTSLSSFGTTPETVPTPSATSSGGGTTAASSVSTPSTSGADLRVGPAMKLLVFFVVVVGAVTG